MVIDFSKADASFDAPFQAFTGEELYPTIQAKSTRLGYGLIKNHCMLDGNKRIGAHAMLVFFVLNGIELPYTQKELYEMVLAVAIVKNKGEALEDAEGLQTMRTLARNMSFLMKSIALGKEAVAVSRQSL